MRSRLAWYQWGLSSSVLALSATLVFALTCGTGDSKICDGFGAAFQIFNTPARVVTDPLLHRIGHILGRQQVGPDTVVAPTGVTAFMWALGWLAFLIYWFMVGAGIHIFWRVLKWSLQGRLIPH